MTSTREKYQNNDIAVCVGGGVERRGEEVRDTYSGSVMAAGGAREMRKVGHGVDTGATGLDMD